MTYNFRKTITIPYTNNQDTVDLINFPFLYSVTDPDLIGATFGGNVQNPSGFDVIFTDRNNVLLDFELLFYNAVTGNYIAFVRLPTYSKTVNTVINTYFGNSNVTTTQANPTGVWDGNFTGVWHLGNGTSLSLSDSTTGGNNGSNNGHVFASTGEIDGGAFFDSSGGFITTANFSGSPTQFTMQAWINCNDSNGRTIMCQGDSTSTNLTYYFRTATRSGFSATGPTYQDIQTNQPSTGVWHLVHLVYTGSTLLYYIDGQLNNSGSTTGSPIALTNAAVIGRQGDNGTNYWFGNLNEVRRSSAGNNSAAARSAGWIATEFANQSSPSTFSIVGPRTSFPSSGIPVVTSAGGGVLAIPSMKRFLLRKV